MDDCGSTSTVDYDDDCGYSDTSSYVSDDDSSARYDNEDDCSDTEYERTSSSDDDCSDESDDGDEGCGTDGAEASESRDSGEDDGSSQWRSDQLEDADSLSSVEPSSAATTTVSSGKDTATPLVPLAPSSLGVATAPSAGLLGAAPITGNSTTDLILGDLNSKMAGASNVYQAALDDLAVITPQEAAPVQGRSDPYGVFDNIHDPDPDAYSGPGDDANNPDGDPYTGPGDTDNTVRPSFGM